MSEAGLLADPQEVRAILVASAKAREPISYAEVLNLLGHHFSRPKMRQLCKVLGVVDEEAASRGDPDIKQSALSPSGTTSSRVLTTARRIPRSTPFQSTRPSPGLGPRVPRRIAFDRRAARRRAP